MNKKIYIIIIPFLLTFILIGLVNAANNGSIGGLFFAYPGEFGYNWNGQTFTKSKYTLDGRNIHTDFGGKTLTTTGSINAGTGTFSNKVTSKSTFSSDPNNTLTTKDYVINEVNKVTKTCPSGQILTSISKTNSTCIVNNLGNHIATTTLNMNGNSISKIGTMYDASNRVTRDAGGGWIRTYGTTGWYNGSFGGGWYMSDSTWLRSYLNKSIYTGGNLLLGGKAYSAATSVWDSANTLTTKGYVINEVNNAKDNLGNHIATTTLNMNGNSISKIGTMYDASNRVTRDAGGGWIRTYGTTGWYNGSFGGGWYMSDSTWLRSYLNKSIYTGGNLLLGGKAYSAATSVWDYANTLTTKGYVINEVNNAKDNLGNHIATTTLNMNGNSISKIGTMYDASNRVTRDAGGGWIRTYGTTGWYNGSFGGGWYMSDSTWLRSYLNKSIYTGGNLLLGGKAYSAATSVWDSANTLTTKDYVDSKLTNNSTYPIFYSKTTGKYWDGKKICKTFLSTATYGSIDGASWGGGILNNLVGLNLGYASLSGWGLNVKNTGSYNLTYCLRNRNNTIQTKLSYPAFTYTSKNKPGNKLNVSVPAKNTGWVNGQAKLGLYIKQNCSGCGKNYLNLGTSSTNDSPVRITSAVFGSISLF